MLNPLTVRFKDSRANIKLLDVYWVDKDGFQHFMQVKSMEQQDKPVMHEVYPSGYACVGIYDAESHCEIWPADFRPWVVDAWMKGK